MCPSLEDLYLKQGDVIEESWYKLHYEIHKNIDELLLGVSPIIKYGYVYGDLIPYKDSAIDIGSPELRINNIFAMTGYFDNDVFVQGKRVIKDGDPISLYDIYELAQNKIKAAVYESVTPELTRVAKLRGYDYANGVWRDIAVDGSGRFLCTLE